MGECQVTVLWIKLLYKCNPSTIYIQYAIQYTILSTGDTLTCLSPGQLWWRRPPLSRWAPQGAGRSGVGPGGGPYCCPAVPRPLLPCGAQGPPLSSSPVSSSTSPTCLLLSSPRSFHSRSCSSGPGSDLAQNTPTTTTTTTSYY